MVQDDKPVGPDGVAVVFEMSEWSRTPVWRWSRRSRAGWVEVLAGDLVRLRREVPSAANAGSQGDGSLVRHSARRLTVSMIAIAAGRRTR
jgi:hypothetical protein